MTLHDCLGSEHPTYPVWGTPCDGADRTVRYLEGGALIATIASWSLRNPGCTGPSIVRPLDEYASLTRSSRLATAVSGTLGSWMAKPPEASRCMPDTSGLGLDSKSSVNRNHVA